MSIGLITLVIIIALLALLLTGFPVAFCLLGVAVAGFLIFVGPASLYAVLAAAFAMMTKDIFIAAPLFIFMASVLQFSGIATAMYEMMYKWFAGLRGGLAMGTVAICALIAAMSGISATGTLTMGMLAYPEMRKRGYAKSLAIGSIPFGGALGPLIPPSVVMIIIGGFASLSVGRLFIGGIIPGVMMAFLAIVYIYIRCLRNPELGPPIPFAERASWRDKLGSLRGTILPILLIILVLGGIYTGAFTPTEAGGIGAFGAVICAAINRQLNWQNVKESSLTTFRVTAMLIWIAVGGASFSSLLGMTGVLHFVNDFMTGLPLGNMGILIVMMGVIFVMGMFIDGMAIVMITLPIFMPIARTLGFDPLWFGLLFSMNLLIGFVTPPFGINLFYFKGLGYAEVTMGDIYRSIIPFVVVMLIVLVLCIAFPELLLWLPNSMIK